MDFKPNEAEQDPFDVPYYEDVDTSDGWQGQGSGKSINTLKHEIRQTMARLGGTVTGMQQGVFGEGSKKPREGFMVYYVFEGIEGKIKIAALPVKPKPQNDRGGHATRREKALVMALYMFRKSLEGLWFSQQLSPGFLPLMPWLIAKGTNKTISELFMERQQLALPAPDGEADILDGNFTETD